MKAEGFYQLEPTPEICWRSIILFGRNVASYKFALGKALMEVGTAGGEVVRLEDLAEPFARQICDHLAKSDKQATSPSSKFLDACRAFNRDELGIDDLRLTTTRLGFQNVIDAFHVVNQDEVPVRFFVDERREHGAIRTTDDFAALIASPIAADLTTEIEARWRLVETAWDLGIARNAVAVSYDGASGVLEGSNRTRRVSITSCRDALNGYQKSRCFYCFGRIAVAPGSSDLGEVDHFFPHMLKPLLPDAQVDGIWNLVLACVECNRGAGGKSARVPTTELLERLSRRNEYLIGSHHPLRETLMMQTGSDEPNRRRFLQRVFDSAVRELIHTWHPDPKAPATL